MAISARSHSRPDVDMRDREMLTSTVLPSRALTSPLRRAGRTGAIALALATSLALAACAGSQPQSAASGSGATTEGAANGAATPAAGAAANANWTPKKTAWGDPDLQGVYTNNDESGIPLERPNQFEGKALDQVGFKLLAAGMTHCLTDPSAAAKAGFDADEVEKLFLKLA